MLQPQLQHPVKKKKKRTDATVSRKKNSIT